MVGCAVAGSGHRASFAIACPRLVCIIIPEPKGQATPLLQATKSPTSRFAEAAHFLYSEPACTCLLHPKTTRLLTKAPQRGPWPFLEA